MRVVSADVDDFGHTEAYQLRENVSDSIEYEFQRVWWSHPGTTLLEAIVNRTRRLVVHSCYRSPATRAERENDVGEI